jgi:HNH endonuclease
MSSSALTPARTPLVVRSVVPVETDYTSYRPYLRKDFLYSCAYCTLTEVEASGHRFTIDHYEPQWQSPALVSVYSNLMYACGECNLRKLDITPPAEARSAGLRFYRPDIDSPIDHFDIEYRRNGWHLKGKTSIGEFSVEYLDLNRHWLLRLRDIRQQLGECVKFTTHGIGALKTFPLDRLPKHVKLPAKEAIQRVVGAVLAIEDDLEVLIAEMAKSHLLDEDPEVLERAKERSKKMLGHKAIYPGQWRAPRKRKS